MLSHSSALCILHFFNRLHISCLHEFLEYPVANVNMREPVLQAEQGRHHKL